jgi:hypothetical protein
MQTSTPPPPSDLPPAPKKGNTALAITAIVVGGIVAIVVAVTALVLFKGDDVARADTAEVATSQGGASDEEALSAVEYQAWWAKEYPADAEAECDEFSKQQDEGWTREEMVQDYLDWLNEPLTAEEEADAAEEQADWPALDPSVTNREIAEEAVDYCFVGGA